MRMLTDTAPSQLMISGFYLDTPRPQQHGWYFADEISQYIILN